MTKIIAIADLKDTGLHIRGRKAFDEDVKQSGWRVVKITVEKAKSRRSDRQRRFYFSGFIQSEIDCFKERWGVTLSKEQVHNWNKQHFFCQEIVDEATGEIYKFERSTNDYAKIEFEEKLEEVRDKFHVAFDWRLPYPNDQLDLQLSENK